MFRKSLFGLVLMAAASLAISAQTAPVSGTVELEKDGVKTPVFNATISVYRTDINGVGPTTTTGRKGEFAFAGLLLQGTYVIAVSAQGCQPTFFPNIKAGMEKLPIILSPGNGNIITESEVRRLLAGGAAATVKEDPDQKKKKEEYDKQVKDATDKNEKARKTNEVINRVVKEAKDAFDAKNYELAISKYDEGIAADPMFVGSAPVFYNYRGASYKELAVQSYNAVVKSTDATVKSEGYAKTKKALANAADSYLKGWNVLANAPAADIVDKANFDALKVNILNGAKDVFKVASLTEQVDPSVIDAAKTMVPLYVGIESDATKKVEANLLLADLYRVTEDREDAVASYKKVLETSPDNPDALAGAGLVLVDMAWLKDNDKAMAQEGADLLQKFVAVAPDTHKLKSGAVEYLGILKAQSIIPTKGTPPKKKP